MNPDMSLHYTVNINGIGYTSFKFDKVDPTPLDGMSLISIKESLLSNDLQISQIVHSSVEFSNYLNNILNDSPRSKSTPINLDYNNLCGVCQLELFNCSYGTCSWFVVCPKCQKVAHERCVDQWIESGKKLCMYCNQPVWDDIEQYKKSSFYCDTRRIYIKKCLVEDFTANLSLKLIYECDKPRQVASIPVKIVPERFLDSKDIPRYCEMVLWRFATDILRSKYSLLDNVFTGESAVAIEKEIKTVIKTNDMNVKPVEFVWTITK